jgi:hypothetical protein
MIENVVHGNRSPQARTAAITAIRSYMREHIKLLAQTAKLFAEPQKHPDANCGNPPRDAVSPNNY